MSNGSDIEEIKKLLASKKSKRNPRVATQDELVESAMNTVLKMDDEALLTISKSISQMVNDKGIIRRQEIMVEEEKISTTMMSIVCPECGSNNKKKKGRSDTGYTRYLCKDCNKSYTLITNTILDGSHYSYDFWKEFIFHLLLGEPVSNIKSLLDHQGHTDITLISLYYMRQQIFMTAKYLLDLEFLKNKMSGIVQMDETYFKENQAGRKEDNMDNPHEAIKGKRLSRKKMKSMNFGIMTDDFANVLACTDSSGRCYAKLLHLGYTDEDTFDREIVPFIDVKNVDFFVSDAQSTFKSFCKKNNIMHFIVLGENYNAKLKLGELTSEGIPITEKYLYEQGKIGEFKYNQLVTDENFNFDFGAYKRIQEGYNLSLNTVNHIHGELKRKINGVYRGVPTAHLDAYIAWYCYTYNYKRKNKTIFFSIRDAEAILLEILSIKKKISTSDVLDNKIENISRIATGDIAEIARRTIEIKNLYDVDKYLMHPEDNFHGDSLIKYITGMELDRLRDFARFCKLRIQRKNNYFPKLDLLESVLSQPDLEDKYRMYIKPYIIDRREELMENGYKKDAISEELKLLIETVEPRKVVKTLSTALPTVYPTKLLHNPPKTLFIDIKTTGDDPLVDEILSITIINGYNTIVCDEIVKPSKIKTWTMTTPNHGITPFIAQTGISIEQVFLKHEVLIKNATEFISYDFEYVWSFIEKYIQKRSRKRFIRDSKSIKDYTSMLPGDKILSIKELTETVFDSEFSEYQINTSTRAARHYYNIWTIMYPLYFDKTTIRAIRYAQGLP